MTEDRGACGYPMYGGCNWIIWLLIILVVICVFCPGIFGGLGYGPRE
ncbi:MAG TPA: hypothetical protein PK733_18925 [Clostridiales bacterium]|nr:hypothetical protein [Clostridiales bacterium]